MFVDTHTHIYSPDSFPGAESEIEVKRAIEAGVKALIFPAVDLSSFDNMKRLASLFPDNIRMAAGIHPTELSENWKSDIEKIEYEVMSGKYIAVGEIGVDLYWEKSTRKRQMEAFDKQTDIAVKAGLPVIIHCRNGLDETLEILRNHPGVKAVFHCFGGDENDIEKIRNVGDYYFGINGIVTFRNSGLANVLSIIGLDRIVLETDSPYLAPVPYRGKLNRSSYIPIIAEKIGQTLGEDINTIGNVTSDNASSLFGKFWK